MNLEPASVKSPVPVVKLTDAKQTSHVNAKSYANVHLEHANANLLVDDDHNFKLNFLCCYLFNISLCICNVSTFSFNHNNTSHLTKNVLHNGS